MSEHDFKPMIFIDGQFNDPKSCPQSVGGLCPDCEQRVEGGYGFAGGYGLGGYNYCETCGKIYDFVEDKE